MSINKPEKMMQNNLSTDEEAREEFSLQQNGLRRRSDKNPHTTIGNERFDGNWGTAESLTEDSSGCEGEDGNSYEGSLSVLNCPLGSGKVGGVQWAFWNIAMIILALAGAYAFGWLVYHLKDEDWDDDS